MKLSNYEKNALYQCKEISEEDIKPNLNAIKQAITNNPEDPFNSKGFLNSDMRVSAMISTLKLYEFHVEKRKIKGRYYPINYNHSGKTAFFIFKTPTIVTPNQFICELSGAINGYNEEKNVHGQLNLLNDKMERNQDFKDNNAVIKYLGPSGEKLKQLLIVNYSIEFNITRLFVNQYDGVGNLIDKIEIKKPMYPTDKSSFPSSDDKNESSRPIAGKNKIKLKLKDKKKKTKVIKNE